MSSEKDYIEVSNQRCFNGQQKVLQHLRFGFFFIFDLFYFIIFSNKLNCNMKFGIYLPDNTANEKLPVLFFLSGYFFSKINFVFCFFYINFFIYFFILFRNYLH